MEKKQALKEIDDLFLKHGKLGIHIKNYNVILVRKRFFKKNYLEDIGYIKALIKVFNIVDYGLVCVYCGETLTHEIHCGGIYDDPPYYCSEKCYGKEKRF